MAYDPTTPHSLLSRAETIAKHIGSVAVGLGHDLMLDVERLVGLAQKPEAPLSGAGDAALVVGRSNVTVVGPNSDSATPTAASLIGVDARAIEELLRKAMPTLGADLAPLDALATVITYLQDIAIDRGDKLIAANTAMDGLKARVAELEGGLSTAIDAGTAAATKLAQAAAELADAQVAIADRDAKLSDATEAQLSMGKTIAALLQPAALAAPPADSAHVAPGAEPFSADVITLNATQVAAATDAPVLAVTTEPAPAVETAATEPPPAA